MIPQSTIGLASGAMPGIQAAGPTSGGTIFTSTSSASATAQENLLLPTNKRDVAETIEFNNSIPLAPFIPSSIREPEFTAKWASDALDQAGERIEKKLCPTIKALLLARDAAHGEAKIQIEDALTLVTAALQESRITREAGRQGFAAAKALRDEMDDPLLTDYQKEVIK